jgi:hypothetical protein
VVSSKASPGGTVCVFLGSTGRFYLVKIAYEKNQNQSHLGFEIVTGTEAVT